MTTRFAIPALAALLFAAPASAEPSDGQLKLDKMLEGRTAGTPQKCILSRPIRNVTIIRDTAVVYESGSTLFVNYTQDPRGLDDDDFLVTRTQGITVCRSDQVTTAQRPEGFYTGNVLLTDFIPYRRDDLGG